MKLGERRETTRVLYIEGPPDKEGLVRRMEYRAYSDDEYEYWSPVFQEVQKLIDQKERK